MSKRATGDEGVALKEKQAVGVRIVGGVTLEISRLQIKLVVWENHDRRHLAMNFFEDAIQREHAPLHFQETLL